MSGYKVFKKNSLGRTLITRIISMFLKNNSSFMPHKPNNF